MFFAPACSSSPARSPRVSDDPPEDPQRTPRGPQDDPKRAAREPQEHPDNLRATLGALSDGSARRQKSERAGRHLRQKGVADEALGFICFWWLPVYGSPFRLSFLLRRGLRTPGLRSGAGLQHSISFMHSHSDLSVSDRSLLGHFLLLYTVQCGSPA